MKALPVRCTLASRIHVDDKSCLLCEHELETSEHLFFYCPYARALRFQTWGLRTEASPSLSSVNWVNSFLDKKVPLNLVSEEDTICVVTITMEDIPMARNEKFREVSLKPINVRAEALRDRLKEIISAISCPPKNHFLQSPLPTPSPLTNGSIIINFDVAIREDFALAACSFRNSAGLILGLITKKLRSIDADSAEAHAASLGIVEARYRGWNSIVI